MSTNQTLADWVTQDGILFSIDSIDSFNNATDKFMASLDDSVKIIALGEALHGGEGFLMLRNKLFKRLVGVHGFSAIAIESSFPKGHIVNEYVNGNGSDSYDSIKESGFSHGCGQLEANRELVEWMQQYNADSSHSTKLRFYGIDSPTEMTGTDSPRQVLMFLLDYLGLIDDESSKARRKRIEALIGLDSDWENLSAMMDASESIGLSDSATTLRIETEDLITELKVRRPELIKSSNEDRYMEAEHYASIARLLLSYHAEMARNSENRTSNLLGIRDAMIADNLVYAASREQNRGKVLVFAHNQHLKKTNVQWNLGPNLVEWTPAGAHLCSLFGFQYVIIGAGLGTSEDNGIGEPECGTLEALLTNELESAMFIQSNKVQKLLNSEISALPTRSGSSRNGSYFPFTSKSLIDFDWLAILKSTGYTRGALPLP